MKHLLSFILCTLFILTSCKKETTIIKTPDDKTISTFYFIRHAEKDRTDITNKNPKLNEKGLLRAEKWSQVFKNVAFDAIYSTNYHRTKLTAAPTAKQNNLEVIIYNSNAIDINKFLKENAGKNVLVVGHSNSTPSFVNKILKNKTYKQIDDNNNANLYTVTVFNDTIISNLLFIK
ncbi:phosphoglycerate mutase family protein [Algibacter aquimarinus]|uniref:SixA phosphatase family protein n=1 Tax=Algibacter aquimarinus TaxID=1136748 RepID=UPI0031EB9C16